jgi:hypothetical protein
LPAGTPGHIEAPQGGPAGLLEQLRARTFQNVRTLAPGLP